MIEALVLFLTGALLIGSWLVVPPTEAGRRRDRQPRGRSERRPSGRLVLASVGCAAAAFLVGAVLTGTWTVGLALVLPAAGVPTAVVRARRRRVVEERREAWPDAIDHLSSAVRAGLSLPEALAGLGERGPASLRPEFARFARDHHATGRFDDSLDLLKERLADPVGDRVVESLRLARMVGGSDLGRVLRTLSSFLRDDLRTRGELESRQSWTVNGARLAVAAPWLVILSMSGRPEVIARYATPTGAVILVGGALTCVIAPARFRRR